MKISIVQAEIAWKNETENLNHLSKLLESVEQTDLIVLPEMFSTGFVTNPEGMTDSGVVLKWMKEEAKKRDCAVAGSVASQDEAGWHNRFYFVTPDGAHIHYDKHHLFTYSGEHKRFTPGDEKVVVKWRGFKILLQVCYDLRFPVFSRNRLSDRYDLALYVASWPVQRAEVWKVLLRARAIENQCFLAGVNRVGDDPGNHYTGDSVVVDFKGNPLASCPADSECVMTTDLDMAALEAFRTVFPVLDDAD